MNRLRMNSLLNNKIFMNKYFFFFLLLSFISCRETSNVASNYQNLQVTKFELVYRESLDTASKQYRFVHKDTILPYYAYAILGKLSSSEGFQDNDTLSISIFYDIKYLFVDDAVIWNSTKQDSQVFFSRFLRPAGGDTNIYGIGEIRRKGKIIFQGKDTIYLKSKD